MEYRAIGAVAGFTVVEAYRKIGGLAGRFYGEIDDVGFAVGVKHFREFQGIGWDFGQIRSGGGNAGGREQSPSYLLADVGMGVGKMFRTFGIEVGENQHGGSGAADFGGHLGAWVSPPGPAVIGYAQQKRYKIFLKKRGHFEESVFDESHVDYHSAEDAVGFRRNDQGAVGGSELSEDGFGVGNEGLEFGKDGLGYVPAGGVSGYNGLPDFGHVQLSGSAGREPISIVCHVILLFLGKLYCLNIL
jgi:hypothetical protein